MKKFTATFFLFLQLVGLSGFILLQLSIERAEVSLDNKLDARKYDDKYLVEIKIPLHLPYTTNGSFERTKGQAKFNGIWYTYVAKRVFQDTLHLLCISNTGKNKIINSSIEDSATEAPFCYKASKVPQIKSIKVIDEYSSSGIYYNFCYSCKHEQFFFKFSNIQLNGVYLEINPPPPKFFC